MERIHATHLLTKLMYCVVCSFLVNCSLSIKIDEKVYKNPYGFTEPLWIYKNLEDPTQLDPSQNFCTKVVSIENIQIIKINFHDNECDNKQLYYC